MSDQRSDDNLPELYSQHLEEWERRFAEAFGACGVDGAIIFSGAGKRRFRDDAEYPFFAEPYFRAWVPEACAGSALRIVPGETPLLLYHESTDYWHMPAATPDGFWAHHFAVRPVADGAALAQELGTTGTRFAAIGEDATETTGFATVNDSALLAHLDFYRAFKTSYEVACIEQANRIAAAGHAATQRALADTPSEFDLNQTYCAATGQRETELPYQNIVALNEHAGVLHYQNLDREPPGEIHSFLLDAGAEFNGYAADVSRTYAGSSESFAELIASVDTMQRRLCAGARNGVGFASLHDLAHRLLAEVLAEHEITRCDADESYGRGITRTFLPHGLGHLLGLQVHDAGGHSYAPGGTAGTPPDEHPFLRLTRTLEPGFVVTIEPGLYFIPSLLEELKSSEDASLVDWGRVDELLPYGGIRIEDNVLVTDSESRNLSRPALLQSGIS